MQPYQKFPIQNFRTGFAEDVEPWLLPRDAYQILKNAHLYRGVIEKIGGYELYAQFSYTETITLSPAPDGITTQFTGTLNHSPSTNNILAQSATNVGATTREFFIYISDTDPNIINLESSGMGTGTINLTTLAVELNFAVPPAIVPGGYNAVILTYDYLASDVTTELDIMGIKPYYKSDGGQDVLVFTTKRLGRVVTLTGLIATAALSDNGITEIPHEVQAESVVTTPVFDGITLTFTGTLAAPIVPGEVNFELYDNAVPAVLLCTVTDNGIGLLTGVGTTTATGFVNYATGSWTLTFSIAPAATDKLNSMVCVFGDVFSGDYTNFFSVANYEYNAFITNNIELIRYYDGTCLKFLNTNLSSKPGVLSYDITKTLHVAIFRNRLLLLLPTVEGVTEQNAVYWSSNGFPLDFTNDEQAFAPTSESIRLFFYITSSLVIRFESSERTLTFTGDEVEPFRFDTTNSIFRCDTRYSAINYDSYGTSVGKAAIVASDGVNVQRADEIIPDFTLNDRALIEGPIISIQQTSIGQCYGERFDSFKEGWLCFKNFNSADSGLIERSDSILAFNYIDKTYAVYTFPFNCLGFGSVTSIETWGNNFDFWDQAKYNWASFYESKDALIDLGGDRNGKVYTLGKGNSQTDANGNVVPVLFDVITKNFNPFIEDGQLCLFGYMDLFVSANTTTKLRVQVYINDIMTLGVDGNPINPAFETILSFTPTDGMSPSTIQSKIWKRVYVNITAKEHTIRFYQDAVDFDDPNQIVRIHCMNLYMKPAGLIFN